MKTSKTSNNLIAVTLSALTITSILPMHVHAKDAIGPGDSDSTWVVGAAAGAFKNPYIGEDEETWISPTVRYNGERVFYRDGSLNIHITKSNGFSAGLKFAVDGGFLFDEDNYRDNPRLSGLNERDATILGGIYVLHDSDLGRLSFNALTDAGNEHDGRLAHLNYTFDLKAGDWHINPELGVQWLSSDLVNHYAGVSESEANSLLGQFTADDSFITSAGIRARYEFDDKWDINFEVGVSKLGSEFKDSPLIDEDLVYHSSIGINYNF